MPLAEGVSARIVYKFYTSPVIVPGVAAISATDPGATGGQILRRVASTLEFTKDTYQSAEIRSDYQIADFRHGVRRVAGNVSGELSPHSYQSLFEASLRSNWVPAVSSSNTVLTSAAADGTASTWTFGGGDPVAAGLRAGMGIRFSGLAATANNATNFVISGFGGTTNRTVSVYPPPTTHAAETTFTLTSVGSTLSIPSTNQPRRKVAFEVYHSDVDIAKLFTECRVGGFALKLPASGMATIEFSATGRDMELYTDVNAPFFTAPAPASTTGLLCAVNGLLRVNGTNIAVITSLDITHTLQQTADPVVGSNLVPEIFSGRSNVTGQMTAFFNDPTLINNFKNEDEIQILAYLTTTSAPNSPAMSFFLPRVKLSGASVAVTGEQGQMITIPFQALKYETTPTATSGVDNTTIQIWDSEVAATTIPNLAERREEDEPPAESPAREKNLARAG